MATAPISSHHPSVNPAFNIADKPRPPSNTFLLADDELIVDSFAGGGGASTGIFMATGRHPDVAINHDPEALAMHAANHPSSEHYCQSIFQVDPREVIRKHKRRIGLAWFSPDCTHHSKARGGRPKEKHIRDLAWVVVQWAEHAVYKGQRPRVIIIENVEEFKDWGALLENGQPCPLQRGKEFKRWVAALRELGYVVEWKELRACDFGAPTSRKRLFIIARCDGQAIAWPKPTHGPDRELPFRTAAECIDWSIPCPSIFLTKEQGRAIRAKRPLAEPTMRRVAHGIKRFVLDAKQPFIVNLTHQGAERNEALSEPFRTITGANRGEKALVSPYITKFRTGSVGSSICEPLHTITAGGKSKRPAGHPHAMGLVAPFLAQHNNHPDGGVNVGRPIDGPVSTITASGSQQGLVTGHLVKLRGTCQHGQPVDEPAATISAQGNHLGAVTGCLLKYYGTDQAPELLDPLHTITSKDRFGLVQGAMQPQPLDENQLDRARQVAALLRRYGLWDDREFVSLELNGTMWIIADIGLRMLARRELFTAQGFPLEYVIAPVVDGKPMSITASVRMCGNSVSPPPADAIVSAQFMAEPLGVAA